MPTWTGRSGAGGAPPAIARRFGAAANPRLLPPVAAQAPPHDDGAPGSGAGGSAEPQFGSAVFGAGARAGTSGGVAPRSADLLAQLAARRAAASAAVDGQDDPEVHCHTLETAQLKIACTLLLYGTLVILQPGSYYTGLVNMWISVLKVLISKEIWRG